MVQFLGKAALVPLDYGSRDENSVLFLSDQYDDLLDLLVSPMPFIGNARGAFRQVPPPDWVLEKPITVILTPGDVPGTKAIQLLQMLNGFEASADAGLMNLTIEKFASIAREVYLDKGVAYLAEFAINTRVLSIVYGPPPVGGPYFTGTYLPATLSRIGANYGYLHFDVETTSGTKPVDAAYNRAFVALDFIEDRTRVVTALRDEAGVKEMTSNIVPAGSALRKTPPGTDLGTNVVLKPAGWSPTVIMESVLPEPDAIDPGTYYTCVCGQAPVNVSGDVVEVGDLLLKGYTCP